MSWLECYSFAAKLKGGAEGDTNNPHPLHSAVHPLNSSSPTSSTLVLFFPESLTWRWSFLIHYDAPLRRSGGLQYPRVHWTRYGTMIAASGGRAR